METPGSKRANLLAQGHRMREEQSPGSNPGLPAPERQRTVPGHRDQPTPERDELRDPGQARRASASPSAMWGDGWLRRVPGAITSAHVCKAHRRARNGHRGHHGFLQNQALGQGLVARCPGRPGARPGQKAPECGFHLLVCPASRQGAGTFTLSGSPKGCPSGMTTLRQVRSPSQKQGKRPGSQGGAQARGRSPDHTLLT